MKKNPSRNEYMLYDDAQFMMFLYRSVEKYLKFKKSCSIAEKLLTENCHDFFISIDSQYEDYSYNQIMRDAKKRNIFIDLSIYDLECSLHDIVSVLKDMCSLELTWLDEHRTIFDKDNNASTFYEEENNTYNFYSSLIRSLSLEDISRVEESLDNMYMLTL